MNILSETYLSRCRKNLFAFISLFIITLLIYSNTFDASWHFDDKSNILDNTIIHVTEFNLNNINKTLFADLKVTEKLYRPIAFLSFALNYYFGKTHVFGYHLVNLLVHFFTSFFLYLFIEHTLNLPILREKYGPHSYFIALLATILWAINPVQTQAVTYIVQRMASMAGLFYIASMFFYVKGRTSNQTSRSISFYILCVLSGSLALGSKENAIMLPFSILLFDLFLIQGISKTNLKRFFVVLLITAAFCLLVVLLLKGPSVFHLPALTIKDPNRGFSLAERLLTQPRVILFYVSLLFYPMPNRLCLEHDIDVSTGLLAPPSTLIAIIVILGLLAIALIKAKKWPLVSFCIIFFFFNHLVEGSVILLELVFEHRNYIPSMLIFLPVSILFAKALTRFSGKKLMRVVLHAFIIALIITFAHSTFIRNFVWKNDESLWLDAIQKNPDAPRPHHNLGNYYFKMGLKDIALQYFTKTITLPERPNRKIHPITLFNIGNYYKTMGDTQRAREYFLETTRLGLPLGYLGLGMIAIDEGANDEAIFYLDQVLKYKSNLLPAVNYKGLALLRENRLDDAIEIFNQGLQIEPNNSYSLTHLGIAYKEKGELGRALTRLKQALGINKKDIKANLHSIELYHLIHQKELTQQTATKLVDLFPRGDLMSRIEKILVEGKAHLDTPDLSIIVPFIEAALLQKADAYRADAFELRKRIGPRSSEKHQTNGPMR